MLRLPSFPPLTWMNPPAEPDLSALARSRWERFSLKTAESYARHRGTSWVTALGGTMFIPLMGSQGFRLFLPFGVGCWACVVFSEISNALLTMMKRQQLPDCVKSGAIAVTATSSEREPGFAVVD
jgi:hypothetical protein